MLWIIVFVISVIAEITIPALVTIWFAFASLIVSILSIFVRNIYIETVIFLALSLAFIVFLRKISQKFFKTKDVLSQDTVRIVKLIEKDNEDNYIYDVKYKASLWTATSKNLYNINDKIDIISFEGNKIKI